MAGKKLVNAFTRSMPSTRPRRKDRESRPRLGQNFLRDSAAAERIVSALGPLQEASVIEIGPGQGALTTLLARRARRLITIELDRVLAAQLRMAYARQGNVEIIEGEVLQVDFANLVSRRPVPLLNTGLQPLGASHERARVVGNLPYYITSPILLHLLQFHEWLEVIVVMVQREVADRIAAAPGSRDYGLLSASVQLFCRVEKLFTLSPSSFSPAPKVHSTVLRLVIAPQELELGVASEPFIDFLKLAFAQKRKTLMNNLKGRYQAAQIAGALHSAKVSKVARAEALTLQQMADVYKTLYRQVTRP